MSKWFSVPCKAVLVSLALFAAACDSRGGEEGGAVVGSSRDPITRPDTRVDEVPSAEPGTERKQWFAADARTRAVTGNLTASVEGRGGPLMLAFATGVTIEAVRDISTSASTQVGVSPPTFSAVLNAEPDATVYLYRVVGQNLAPVAKQGLCGATEPRFLAISEYVGADGKWVFRVAVFEGETLPGPGAQADPVLCATYNYAVQ